MKSALFLLLSSFISFTAQAYDCSGHVPFVPVEYQPADIYVGRFYWIDTDDGKAEISEDVCETPQSLSIPVLDIRGREEEWFYCHDEKNKVVLECKSNFQNQTAVIQTLPAIVIRTWGKTAARDTHFHTYVIPNSDPTKYFDLFARNLSPNLSRQVSILDAAGGGRGENSGIDSFYVRVDFK